MSFADSLRYLNTRLDTLLAMEVQDDQKIAVRRKIIKQFENGGVLMTSKERPELGDIYLDASEHTLYMEINYSKFHCKNEALVQNNLAYYGKWNCSRSGNTWRLQLKDVTSPFEFTECYQYPFKKNFDGSIYPSFVIQKVDKSGEEYWDRRVTYAGICDIFDKLQRSFPRQVKVNWHNQDSATFIFCYFIGSYEQREKVVVSSNMTYRSFYESDELREPWKALESSPRQLRTVIDTEVMLMNFGFEKISSKLPDKRVPGPNPEITAEDFQ